MCKGLAGSGNGCLLLEMSQVVLTIQKMTSNPNFWSLDCCSPQLASSRRQPANVQGGSRHPSPTAAVA
jgi:hypothetical protein